jgi:hypothetical protein
MKRLLVVLLFLSLPNVYAQPQQRPRQGVEQNKLRPADRPRAAGRRALLEEAVYAFYVEQVQQQAELSPDVFVKVLPFVRQFIRDRFEIGDRRSRAVSQLRQAILAGGSEADLRPAIRELDAADADFQSNQAKFLSNVDPLLNARQQAKLRLIQVAADNRIRQALQNAQNPARENAPANSR